jgi:MSHA biogenesis protein MshJ
MKAWWKIQSGRINALSLRERAFLFVTLIICLLALADTLWISPTQSAYRQTTLKLSTQNEELQRLRVELGSLYSRAATSNLATDPNQILRNDINTAKERLQVLDKAISELTQRAQNARSIEAPLMEFLRRQEGLTLLGTRTLGGGDTTPETAGLLKQKLELRVSGSYPQLSRYVRTLEEALPDLRWGQLEIRNTPIPSDKPSDKPELTVQVHVVGVSP